jgi:hypothetical protein
MEAVGFSEEFCHPEGGHSRFIEESFYLGYRGNKFLLKILLLRRLRQQVLRNFGNFEAVYTASYARRQLSS